ncbi:MAG: periplasmic binding protein/LacI transcriptional regulator [Ferruginibacter sp.]|nr:periplasmic binding protein/LacI transcriptional regulator [Ferruginibacter sp.]
MPKHRFVTIKDIAKVLKISVSTVSRALRDTYDVNQETRTKVMEAAAQMNYKPNYNAIGLAKGSSHNIGIVIPFITNYYFSTVITGIQEVAFSKGYNIILFISNDSPERELSIIQDLSISNLDGLMVTISSDSDSCEHFQKIIDQGIPVVFFDRVANKIKTSKVMQDDFYGAIEAVEHLIENGYKKIAHIAGPKGLIFTERRLQGYLGTLKKNDLPIREEWIIHSGFSQVHGEEDTRQLLNLDERPDAIFAVNDRKAIGAMLVLKTNKIAIGKDFGVVGFTNDPMSTIISPALTTIAEPALEIGRKSCELLIKHILKKNFIFEEVIIPGRLIVRESTNRHFIA